MFTVIVTGSRDLKDKHRVIRALDGLYAVTDGCFYVRHGDCPTGADKFAKEWVEAVGDWDVSEIPDPADWANHGKAAGPIRTRGMAQAGADLCLALPPAGSRGTGNCVNESTKAGIPVEE